MLRRLNYTNRLRIRREDIRIQLSNADGVLAFDADLSRIRNYDLPTQSLVFVEAYRQTNWMRFAFGRIGALLPPADRRLSQFDSAEGVRFRVKVVPESDAHKLLAEADAIPLLMPDEGTGDREPLLPVKPAQLDGEVFRLDYSGDWPILLIHREAGAYSDIGRSLPFVSLVYPAVFREIMTRLLLVDKHFDDSSEDDWRSKWLRFATSLPGSNELPAESASEDDVTDWIDGAVAAFARRVQAVPRFLEFWTEGA
jgi:hypothetical protein